MIFEMLFAAAAIAASVATPDVLPSQDYAHPQQLVAVDGARRLNLFCMGKGEPTVMFESGAGDSMWVWHKVQGAVAKVTRACAYDRAGYGFSDAATRASDAQISEYKSFTPQDNHRSADQVEVEAAKFSFGDKPLIVLTHSKPIQVPGLTAAQIAAAEKAWSDGHDRIAAESTRGSNTVVPNTSHYIQIDAPGVVIDAVKKVVAEVRAGK